ncbi:MAG: ATP-grasp domain-containing protein [Pyrinomonadaceae bacterium]|nr:ATP-grasp domain-containing protein [Pyrinomonadaceae bacterium]
MNEISPENLNLVIIASDFKGNPFIKQAKKRGCHVRLVTREKCAKEAWVRDSIDEIHTVSDNAKPDDYLQKVVALARYRPISHVVGMDEFDVLTSAATREFLQINVGLTVSHANVFRDKLKMRTNAKLAGIAQPEFVALFNSEDIVRYIENVEPPWIIKPRTEVSAYGIRKIENVDELWSNLAELDLRDSWRDNPSQFLLEKFIPGKVFHVDSLISKGECVFSGVSNYGTPPLNVTHQGGVFTTSVLPYESEERTELLELNQKLISAFGHQTGVTHAEFLRCEKSGRFYLLEIAARVGGAYIADALEAASGVNLWCEWANLELSQFEIDYSLPETRNHFAGVVLSLANCKEPDTAHYVEEEIVHRVRRDYHAGFVVTSERYERVQELLGHYSNRFVEDFLTIAPARERHDD